MQHNDQQAEMKTAMENMGLKLVKPVKSGVTGDIGVYHYTGNDPNIKKMTDAKGYLIVKSIITTKDANDNNHAVQSFRNEVANINILNQAENINRSTHRPLSMSCDLGNGTTIILNECVWHDANKMKCMDMDQHLRELGESVKSDRSVDKFALCQQILQLLKGTHDVNNELVACGLLHLDWAPRNFVITENGEPKGIDFATSLQMNRIGFTNPTPDQKFNTRPLGYNQAALQHDGAFNMHTNLFNFRTSMLEALASLMNLSRKETDSLYFPNRFLPPLQKRMSQLAKYTDEHRIDILLDNINATAIELRNRGDIRGQMVQVLMEQCRPYLANSSYQEMSRLTDANQAKFDGLMQADDASFAKCINQFNINEYDVKLAAIEKKYETASSLQMKQADVADGDATGYAQVAVPNDDNTAQYNGGGYAQVQVQEEAADENNAPNQQLLSTANIGRKLGYSAKNEKQMSTPERAPDSPKETASLTSPKEVASREERKVTDAVTTQSRRPGK
jgi:hypothetical protein